MGISEGERREEEKVGRENATDAERGGERI